MCAKANLVSCAPACDEQTYGFLLSIEIDGRGTVMTCNKVDGVFSWQGQASLGGYIGANFDSLFSSVVSGAAGTFMGTLTHDAGIGTDLTIQPGQAVLASGDITSLAQQPPLWGSGGFTVQERGSLSLTYVTAEGEFTVLGGARGVASLTLQSSVMSGSVSVTSGVLIVKDSTLSGSIVSADTSASLSACTLGASVTLTTTSIWPSTSSMSLDNMAVPSAVLTTAKRLSGVGSTLRLSAITVLELPNQVALTGTMTVDDDSGPSAPKTIEPPGWDTCDRPTSVRRCLRPVCMYGIRRRELRRTPRGLRDKRGLRDLRRRRRRGAWGVQRLRHGEWPRLHHAAGRLATFRLRLPGGRGADGRRWRELDLERRRVPRQRKLQHWLLRGHGQRLRRQGHVRPAVEPSRPRRWLADLLCVNGSAQNRPGPLPGLRFCALPVGVP